MRIRRYQAAQNLHQWGPTDYRKPDKEVKQSCKIDKRKWLDEENKEGTKSK